MNDQKKNKDSEIFDDKDTEIRKSDFDTFFADLDKVEEEVSSEAYDLVVHALSLVEGQYFDDAIEILRQAIGLYSQINRIAEIEALNNKISDIYLLKEEVFRESEIKLSVESSVILDEQNEIYDKTNDLINKANELINYEKFDEALDNYDEVVRLFHKLGLHNEIEKINKLIEECYNIKADYLKRKKQPLIQDSKEVSEVELKRQRIIAFEETKKHEEEISNKAFEILDRASELAKIRQYDQAINLYLRGEKLFEEINWSEEANKIKITIEQIERLKIKDETEMAQLIGEMEENAGSTLKEMIEKAQIEEEIRIQNQAEKISEITKRKNEEEFFKNKIRGMIDKAERLAREYDTEMKKAIRKGYLVENCVYPKVIAIYEEVRQLVAEKGWQEQFALYSDQIAHYYDLLEKDGKLRQIELQKREKQKEYEDLQKIKRTEVSESEIERMKAIAEQRILEQQEEEFRNKIDQMIRNAENLAREYDIEMKKAIRKGNLVENCVYPKVIAIYEEVRQLVAEKGWQEQFALYSDQIAHYRDLFERDKKLRQIELQKHEKQKEYEDLQKIKRTKVSESEIERMKAIEEQRILEQQEEEFRSKIDQMIRNAENLAREYDIEMKKAIKKGNLVENCVYPEVIAIYEEVRQLVVEKGWQEQFALYSDQIAHYYDLFERDKKLRQIELQKHEKQKEYEELQRIKKIELSESERERTKAIEEQRILEQQEEEFRNKIDEMISKAERLAREYDIKLKKVIKKGDLNFKSKYPEIIEIYTEARKLVQERGFENEVVVYSNQLKKYLDLLEKEKKLREIEAQKVKKKEEFEQLQKVKETDQITGLDIKKKRLEQEEEIFEKEIDLMIDKSEKMAREYELAIKRGDFQQECPYPKIIEIYKNIRERVYIRGWTEEAKIYTNQIILYQEKLERDGKLREIEARKEIEQQQFKEGLKKIDTLPTKKVPEIEERDIENEKLLEEAMNIINNAENEVKSYELSLKKDILIYKSPYEKAISNYEKARKIFKRIGWVEESNRILNTINFYKEKKARDDNLREIEKEKLQKAKIEEARAKYIPDYKVFAREQKIIDFEKLKKKETQDSDPIFNLINKAERMAQDYEFKKKDGIFNVASPYQEIINLYKQAKSRFEKIGWNEEANQLVNSINYYKEKLEADNRVRELEIQKLEKEKELEEKKKVQARLAREAEAELLKQKAHAIELKRRKGFEYEAKKEQAFNFMDLAKKELKQNNFDKAVRFYQNSDKIFTEINWPEGIRIVNESINLIKSKKEALEREKQLLKIKEEEELKLKADLEEQIAKAQDLKDLQEEKRKQELLVIQEQQEYEKKVSEQAYKLLEDGTQLKNLKKFEQAYEKYIMGRDLFEKIGWAHEVSRINNDLLFILKKEMKQVEKIKAMQKRKLEEEKEIEVLLREADEKRKEVEKVRKEEKRKKRKSVIQQRLEEANNIIKDLKYNEGILMLKKVIKKLEKGGQEKQIKQVLKQIEVLENASQVPIITINDIENNENLEKFTTAYKALDRAQLSLSENQFMRAISEFNEAQFNLRNTIVGQKYIPIIKEKINVYKKDLGIRIEPEEELEIKESLDEKDTLRKKIAARREERRKRVDKLLGKR